MNWESSFEDDTSESLSAPIRTLACDRGQVHRPKLEIGSIRICIRRRPENCRF